MLYAPSKLIKADYFDFSKTYNPTTCSPQAANMLNELQNLRQAFYGMFDHISLRSDHDLVENVDFMTQMAYLDKVPELMEYSVTGANFPLLMSWESGAWPGSKHVVQDDNEAAATTELILSRVLAALGTMSSARGHIAAFRLATSQKNQFQAKAMLKPILERALFSSVRLYKLNHCQNYIYPGLHNRPGPIECSKDYALQMYLIMELNMSSMMVDKAMLDPVLSEDSVKMICNNSLIALGKVARVKAAFQSFNCQQTQEVLGFCAAAEFYFETMMLMSIFELNRLMQENIISRDSKNSEQLYVEMMVLGNYLLDLRDKWSSILKGLQNDPNPFVSRENIQHTLSHFDNVRVDQMKQAIGRYEAVKDGIDSKQWKHFDINQLKGTLVAGEDNVNNFIKNKTGIVFDM